MAASQWLRVGGCKTGSRVRGSFRFISISMFIDCGPIVRVRASHTVIGRLLVHLFVCGIDACVDIASFVA